VLLQTAAAQDDAYQIKHGERRSLKEPGRIISGAIQQPPSNASAQRAFDPFMGPRRAPALGPEFAKAVEALREAEDDQSKSKAEDHLRDLLTEYFGEDMKRREAELKEMAKRLKKLEEQLELRNEKMDEIVDLQMKVLVNQAEGLGFFSNGPSSDSQPSQNFYWYHPPRPTIVAQPPVAPIIPPSAPVPAEAPTAPRPARAAPVAPPTERYVPPEPTIEAAPQVEGDNDPAAKQR
jgi:hypothetical protein